MFRVELPPSTGAHTTVSTASGICHTVTAIWRYRGRVGTGLSVLWVAYATQSTLKQQTFTYAKEPCHMHHFQQLINQQALNKNVVLNSTFKYKKIIYVLFILKGLYFNCSWYDWVIAWVRDWVVHRFLWLLVRSLCCERAWFVSDVKSGVAMVTGFPSLRRNIFPLRKIAPTDESTDTNIWVTYVKITKWQLSERQYCRWRDQAYMARWR
jgi:hypothetical protein